jgi:hypothetical protein
MTDQPSNTDFETEAEHNAEAQAQTEAVAEVPEQTNALSMTSGLAAPPSPTLDTEDGGSDWDAEGFVPPTLEEMPTEGPGSPGFDVYAPENAKYLNPQDDSEAPVSDETADSHDDEDVKAALEAETADGAGETPEDQLPESDVDPNEELAEDYPDLEPRGDVVADETKDNA